MNKNTHIGIYDFEIFPYALGDVLTWNVRTAIRCLELGRSSVDIYLCIDEENPAGIHQYGMINKRNSDLFFTELYTAFGTHPMLGSIFIYRKRSDLISRLEEISAHDSIANEALDDYLGILRVKKNAKTDTGSTSKILTKVRNIPILKKYIFGSLSSGMQSKIGDMLEPLMPNDEVINRYFTKYIYSHKSINKYAEKFKTIPYLKPALGCAADVDEWISTRLNGKEIVTFHLRMRRLDAGFGGETSYSRDSDYLEWYDFIRRATEAYPNLIFIALGRLQEKPIELLRLPNVLNLRELGLGLGHELTLIDRADLFIGSSSGFAAYANFSKVPYFITHMNPGSCDAYDIPNGVEHLPFSLSNQKLIYEEETSELLMGLLHERFGPGSTESREKDSADKTPQGLDIEIDKWLNARLNSMNADSTICRYEISESYKNHENSFLILASLIKAKELALDGKLIESSKILQKINQNFPELATKYKPIIEANKIFSRIDQLDAQELVLELNGLNLRSSGYTGSRELLNVYSGDLWSPLNFSNVGCEILPIDGGDTLALKMKSISQNSFWHSESFAATRSDGRIVVNFKAKSEGDPCLDRMYIFQNGKYHSVGEFYVENEWLQFSIPITIDQTSILEFQIDHKGQGENWLHLKDFLVEGAIRLPRNELGKFEIPLGEIVATHSAGTLIQEGEDQFMEWPLQNQRGYFQSKIFNLSKGTRALIKFQAKASEKVESFTSMYLFEGSSYKTISQFAFTGEWRDYEISVDSLDGKNLKFQIDYPIGVEKFSIKDVWIYEIEPISMSIN